MRFFTSKMALEVVEVIGSRNYADRLYWVSHADLPRGVHNAYYFSIDSVPFTQELIYRPFCHDFGPLHLGMIFHYCHELDSLLSKPHLSSHKIYHYTSKDPIKRVNSAFLMCAYGVLVIGKTAAEIWSKFANLPVFLDYRDASMGACTYKCTVLHCLKGLEIAIKLGWLDYSTFNLSEYERLEQLENGDMNWIIPGKLLAFSCPSVSQVDEMGYRCYTPEDYVPVFKSMGITAVVRLNKKTYPASVSAK